MDENELNETVNITTKAEDSVDEAKSEPDRETNDNKLSSGGDRVVVSEMSALATQVPKAPGSKGIMCGNANNVNYTLAVNKQALNSEPR